MSSFGMARTKREGGPAHPDDVYTHCGCAKCDEKYRRAALAYYKDQIEQGVDISNCEDDPWFPAELKAVTP